MNKELNLQPRPKRMRRRDGATARQELLSVAGRVFAERGFSDATSKEICALAGVNSAAVNYYFGSKEGLYEEVLVEAHKQLFTLEEISTIIDSSMPVEEKLHAFLGHFIQIATSSSELWGIRVFLREFASPTQLVNKALLAAIFPKMAKFKELIHSITGLPVDSAEVQRAVTFVVLPCISMIMIPEALRLQLLPASKAQGMLDDMTRYALGGLRALGAKI